MKIRAILTLATTVVTLAAQAELLEFTFGAGGDKIATYGGNSASIEQDNSSEPAPVITVSGLDIDGIGGNDDAVEVVFALANSTETANLLRAGYRYDPGDVLTFNITSTEVILGNAANTHSINTIGFTSVGNNTGATVATVTSTDPGFTTLTGVTDTIDLTADLPGVLDFSLLNTSAVNGRARRITAQFNVIPEPSTLGMLASSTMGMLFIRFKMRV